MRPNRRLQSRERPAGLLPDGTRVLDVDRNPSYVRLDELLSVRLVYKPEDTQFESMWVLFVRGRALHKATGVWDDRSKFWPVRTFESMDDAGRLLGLVQSGKLSIHDVEGFVL